MDRDLFLRIAPELYLKRLLVGGFERVFEINRSFRNEGLSTRHNPEFTMLEYYEAYSSLERTISFTESMIQKAAETINGESYGGTRVMGLALELQEKQWMYLNGVIMVSPADYN